MLAALPFRLSSVDVPAGMSAALELALHERGIPTLGIWAQVPHYVVSMAYPGASVALLDGLATATGITIAADELRGEAVAHRQRIDQLIAANDEHQGWSSSSSGCTTPPSRPRRRTRTPDGGLEMRSGDELAAEVERFLRDQGKS